ncbi:MAG TPA: extracellular solute-binding protein [Chloroflexota bacterium]|nr:extracellular solute-binding protein [Chloroflexota bacterium]
MVTERAMQGKMTYAQDCRSKTSSTVSRRRLLAAGAFTGLAGSPFAAACATGAGPQQSSTTLLDTATARAVAFWPRNATDKIAFDAMLPLAKQQFPNLTVTLEVPATNMVEKLKVAIASDTPPDGIVLGLGIARNMTAQKVVLSLQDYLKRDKQVEANLKSFSPATIQAYTFENQLHALPATNEGIVLWYHKDAFADARLPFPRDIENDPAKWNWNTVVDMARALNRGSGTDRQRYGLMVTGRKTNAAISESWGNVVYANDGRFLDDKGATWTLNSKEGLGTIQWAVDLQTRHGVHPEVDHYLEQNVLDRTLFQQGRLGMLIQGEFLSRYLYGNQKPAGGIPFNYDMAQLPFGAGKTKRACVYNGNGLAMIRGTKQPDGMWQWLHVLSTKDAQQQITNNWGSRGAHTGTYDTWLKDGGGGGPAGLNYQAIVKTGDYARSYPVSPFLDQDALVTPCTTILYDQVFVRKMTPLDGLRQMESEINARLKSAGAT